VLAQNIRVDAGRHVLLNGHDGSFLCVYLPPSPPDYLEESDHLNGLPIVT